MFGRVEHSISVLRLYFCLINVLFTFLSSHWEKYNTGILFLPWGYDVSQLVNIDETDSSVRLAAIINTVHLVSFLPVHLDHLFDNIYRWLRVLEIHVTRWYHCWCIV